jgi:hypothetical protein
MGHPLVPFHNPPLHPNASFLNASFRTAHTFRETHLFSICHPSSRLAEASEERNDPALRTSKKRLGGPNHPLSLGHWTEAKPPFG